MLLLIQLNSSVQLSEFDEGFDMKLSVKWAQNHKRCAYCEKWEKDFKLNGWIQKTLTDKNNKKLIINGADVKQEHIPMI